MDLGQGWGQGGQVTAPSSRPLQGSWAVTPSLLGAHGNPPAGAEAGKLGRHVLQDTRRLSGEHAQVFRGTKPQESPENPNAASGSLLVSAKMTENVPVALVEFVLPGVHTVLPAPQTPPPARPPEMPPPLPLLSGELCITF